MKKQRRKREEGGLKRGSELREMGQHLIFGA